MATSENGSLMEEEIFNDSFDFDDVERRLDEELDGLLLLEKDRDSIGSPDSLGEKVVGVVWEQIINQIGAVAGKEFIEENRGMTLDLRSSAHIQSVDNFEKQKYANHNQYVDYESRGKEYRADLETDPNKRPNAKQKQEQRFNKENGTWETYDNVDQEWKKQLKPDYRQDYEKDRQKDKSKLGNKTVHKDHQVPDAEIARDIEAATYMDKNEKIQFANSDANLNDLDKAANQSKSDHNGEKWIKHVREGEKGKGQTNGEYFGIDEEEYINEKEKPSREAWEEEKERKKQEEIELGKKSQKEEVFRMGKSALKAAIMQMFAEFVKSVFAKFVSWMKEKGRTIKSLIERIKNALKEFISDIKTKVLNVGKSVVTAIETAIIGPVVEKIQKVITLIKQSWSSLKDAVKYLRDPANKDKPFGIKVLEVGKIVIAALTGVGAVLLGEVVSNALMPLPGFSVSIAGLGTLAGTIGILVGGIVAGIIGAIAIRKIEKTLEKKEKEYANKKIVEQGNAKVNQFGHEIQKGNNHLKDEIRITKNRIKTDHQEANERIRTTYKELLDNKKAIETNGAQERLGDSHSDASSDAKDQRMVDIKGMLDSMKGEEI